MSICRIYNNIIILIICAFTVLFVDTRQDYAYSDENKDFLFAKQALEDEFYDIAKDRIISFITSYPGSKNISEARLYLGRAYFKLNKLDRAKYEFEYIVERPESAAFSDEAKIGRAHV